MTALTVADAVTAESLLSDNIALTGLAPLLLLETAREHNVMFSSEEFFTLYSRAGKDAAPGLLVVAWSSGMISEDVITASIGGIWSGASFPQETLVRADWLELFNVAGFTIGGKPTERPGEPVRLYRGCSLAGCVTSPGQQTPRERSGSRGGSAGSQMGRTASGQHSYTRPMRHLTPCYAFPETRDARTKQSM
jgi:hypothetical protein